MTAITYEEMLRRYRAISHKAIKVRYHYLDRAWEASTAAGIGTSLGTAGHNAMIAYREGRPWKEVDYALLRRAFHLMERSFEPERLAQRAWERLYEEWRQGGFQYERKAHV